MTTPTQVLDEQASLLAAVSLPSYAEYAAAVTLDEYLKVKRVDQRRREQMLDANFAHVQQRWLTNVPLMVKAAYAFHVSDEMLQVANWAGHLLPEDVTLDRDLLPTDCGFLVFEKGMQIPEVWGRKTYVHAMLWRHGGNHPAGPSVEIFLFTDVRDRRDEVTQELVKNVGEDELLRHGHLHLMSVNDIAYSAAQPTREEIPDWYRDVANKPDGITEPVEWSDNWVRTLIAIFTLMGQTVADVSEEEADRKQARRMRRMDLPSRVTVIRLRRTEGSRHEGESEVEWQHRWVVRGHWRNQPYGPQDGPRQYRRIWIAPHVKGPEDKPLVVTDKVYTLNR
jgi:hypothetical protein